MHFSAGAFLQPGDYHGLSTILVQDATTPRTASDTRVARALAYLMDAQHGNPLVRQTLTCFERELARNVGDAFPAAAGGGGALPIMQWDDQALRCPEQMIVEQAAIGQPQARVLAPQGITGLLQTVVEPPTDATLRQNAAENHTVGNRRARNGAQATQPLIAESAAASIGCALHPTLYHTGRGDWHRSDIACDEAHFRKLRLASVNPKFRAAHEVPSAMSSTVAAAS